MPEAMQEAIYAIGDIHGQLEQLQGALERIERDGGPDAQVIFLGDYTDRGANSQAVLDLLIAGQQAGKNWRFILGNHDRMFAMFMEHYPRTDDRLLVGFHWFHARIGGIETLQSYGVAVAERDRIFQVHARAMAAVPPSHLAFLRSLEPKIVAGDLLFVHAGIRPGVALCDQDVDDLVWIRDEFLHYEKPHDKLVVHGHTFIDKAKHYGNRVNLDSGAAYGHDLSAAVFEGRECWLLTEDGRKILRPEN